MSLFNQTEGQNNLEQNDLSSGRKKPQPVLWLLFFVIAVILLLRNVTVATLFNIFIISIGIGVIVAVHEFGHFLLAKLTGMNVQAFSIGFPPVLMGIKRTDKGYRFRILPRISEKADEVLPDGTVEEAKAQYSFTVGSTAKAGETEYCIGLIPFGGFVKILGQEDIGRTKSTDDPRSYANKPVFIRMLVIGAGVVFNVILAMLIFFVVFRIGINFIPPLVGGVVPGLSAQKAGLKAGDEIIDIGGKTYCLDFADIAASAALSRRGQEVPVKVKREDGSVKRFELVSEEVTGRRVFGIGRPQTLTIAKFEKEQDNKKLLEQTGLVAGDKIIAVDSAAVKTYWQMEEIIENAFKPFVTATVEREPAVVSSSDESKAGPETFDVRLRLVLVDPNVQDPNKVPFGQVYGFVPRIRVASLMDGLSPKARLHWLKEGDVILKVGDVEDPNASLFRKVIDGYHNKELAVEVLRKDANGIEGHFTAVVVPRFNPHLNRLSVGVVLVPDYERAVVAEVFSAGKGKTCDIPAGAVITAVNGVKVETFYDIAKQIAGFVGRDVTISWSKGSRSGGALFVAENWRYFGRARTMPVENIPFEDLRRLYKADNPLQAFVMGCSKAMGFLEQSYLTWRNLLQGQMNPKELVGPVGIVKLLYPVVKERQFIYYAFFIGLISIFIVIANILPLLPFDGGHLLFLLIEKIKGSPVSEKVQFVFSSAGLVFVVLLFALLTINDIIR